MVLTFEVWDAEAHFLVEAAPHRWLAPGTVFEMMAGARVAATIEGV
jgi:hypothetical protein